MANRFLNNVTINDEYTLPSADGTADQIITTDGAGQLSFVDQSTINAGNAEHVVIYAKNTSGSQINKGTPVYITGTVGATDTVTIAPADAGNSSHMPAVGLLDDTLSNNAFGYVITGGFMDNITTDPIDGDQPASNDTVYVKVGGGLTLTKPIGPGGLIQNIAKVGKVSGGNSGSLIVSSILRTNDIPNLTAGKIWVGTANNTAESTVVHLDETNGRMGIGTTSPDSKLNIEGTKNTAILTLGNTTSGSTWVVGDRVGGIDFYSADGSGGGVGVKASISYEDALGGTGSSQAMVFRTGGNTSGTNNVERMRLQYNGNVGIGDTSPTQISANTFSLSVNSSRTDLSGGLISKANGTVKHQQYWDTSGYNFSLAANSGNFKFIGGNVGIGTTSPSEKLEVVGAIKMSQNASYPLTIKHNSSTSTNQIDVVGGLDVICSNNNMISFKDATTTNMTISGYSGDVIMGYNTGKVGIGTTSPTEKLTIENGNIRLNSTNNSISQGLFARSNNSSPPMGGISWNQNPGFIGSEWYHYKQTSPYTQARIRLIGDASSGGMFVNLNGSDVFTIKTSSGNAGIGTTSPGYKLDVAGDLRVDNGNIGSTSGDEVEHVKVQGARHFLKFKEVRTANDTDWKNTTFKLQAGVDSTNHQSIDFVADGSYQEHIDIRTGNQVFNTRFDANGNVGIGTASPGAKLEVEQSNSSTNTVFLSNSYNNKGFRTGNSGYATFSGYQDSNNTVSGSAYGALIGLNTFYNGTNFYNDNQYVDPSSILFKDGSILLHTNDISATGNFTPSERLRITKTGNVGIGTTSPNEKLEVNGAVKATATTDAYKGYIKQNVVSFGAEKVESINYYFTPYNTTSTSTSAQAYNRMVAPYDGRVKKVYIRHAGGLTPTATAVNFKKHTNGTTSSAVYAATVANTASTNMTAYYEFGNSDFTFNAGDLIGLLYQTTDAFGTASKIMGAVAITITLEYNIT